MRATPLWIAVTGLLVAGCSSDGRPPGPQSPDPAAGRTGTASEPTDDETQRVLCQWHTELTPDGRTIQVPTYYLVDEHGRVVRRLKDSELK